MGVDTAAAAREEGRALVRAVRGFLDDDMLTYSAALAYQVLFALVPLAISLVSLLGFLNMDPFYLWLRVQAGVALPGPAIGLVDRVMGEVRERHRGVLSASALLALWSASSGVRRLMTALNRAFGLVERRPAWKRYLLSAAYTVALAAALLTAAGLLLAGTEITALAAEPLGLAPEALALWGWLRLPLAVVLLSITVGGVYALLPAARQPFEVVSPGAVIAVLTWVAASAVFGLYVRRVGGYSAAYGSLGAVVILIFYFHLSAAALLLGAEINWARRVRPGAARGRPTSGAAGDR